MLRYRRMVLLTGMAIMSPLAGAAANAAHSNAAPKDSLVDRVEAFLSAYAVGNEPRVMAFVSSGQPHIYGSDEAEAIDSRDGFAAMLRADHKLWNGPVSFGPMRNVSEERSGNLATIFFDAGFKLGGHEVPVRFSMVWRREAGAWKLVQSSNVVPTTGQSAAAILKH